MSVSTGDGVVCCVWWEPACRYLEETVLSAACGGSQCVSIYRRQCSLLRVVGASVSVSTGDGVVCCVWWEPVCQYLQETVLSAACGGSQCVGIYRRRCCLLRVVGASVSVSTGDGVVCCVWWEPVCRYLQETVFSAACGGSQCVGIYRRRCCLLRVVGASVSVSTGDGVVCCVWWEPVCQYLQETVLSAACGGSQCVGIYRRRCCLLRVVGASVSVSTGDGVLCCVWWEPVCRYLQETVLSAACGGSQCVSIYRRQCSLLRVVGASVSVSTGDGVVCCVWWEPVCQYLQETVFAACGGSQCVSIYRRRCCLLRVVGASVSVSTGDGVVCCVWWEPVCRYLQETVLSAACGGSQCVSI